VSTYFRRACFMCNDLRRDRSSLDAMVGVRPVRRRSGCLSGAETSVYEVPPPPGVPVDHRALCGANASFCDRAHRRWPATHERFAILDRTGSPARSNGGRSCEAAGTARARQRRLCPACELARISKSSAPFVGWYVEALWVSRAFGGTLGAVARQWSVSPCCAKHPCRYRGVLPCVFCRSSFFYVIA